MRTDYDAIDLSTLEFWSGSPCERDEAFAVLRRERPVSWQRPYNFGLAKYIRLEGDDGYWALTRHEHISQVSRDPVTFGNRHGVTIEEIPAGFAERIGSFMLMDGNRHLALRRVVSLAFTPRHMARMEAQIRQRAREIVDRLLEIGDCDFVAEVSMQLPMWTISELLGIPEADRERVAALSNRVASSTDPQLAEEGSALTAVLDAVIELNQIAAALAQDRRKHPRDDVLTALVEAEVDGRRLTDDEIGGFLVLLGVGGNDTSRNTTSVAMRALCENPEQRRYLAQDVQGRLPVAVEEFARWSTPVMTMRRTATRDIEIDGQKVLEGDKVLMLYVSANRDEAVFDDPWRFEVTRHPNDHFGFGARGPHYCLGAPLARTQLRAIFSELLLRVPSLEVGEPVYVPACFITNIRAMPCTL
jgi:cytochrome P450